MSAAIFRLGGDVDVRRMGYGAMRLCGQPGNFGPYPDWSAGIALIRRAVELGVNFFDTAHAYGPGWNESLLGEALSPFKSSVVIATKGGVEKTAADKVFPDGRPETLRRRCEESLTRLQVERIALYQLHRPDPGVPFSESIGALAQLQAEGKILHIGLSNVGIEQIEAARAVVRVASVQNRYNFLEREDEAVLQHCARHGIAYLPWGPLAAKPFAPEAPLTSEARLSATAASVGLTPGQLALAWLLHHSPNILLIPGTTSVKHLEENMRAATIGAEPIRLLNGSDVAAAAAR